jgi:two-component system OmpR family sensor kinase
MITKARRTIAAQIVCGVLAGLVLAGAVVGLFVTRAQDAATGAVLRQAVAQAARTPIPSTSATPAPSPSSTKGSDSGEGADAPADKDVWICKRRPDGSIAAPSPIPTGLPDRPALERVAQGGKSEISEVHTGTMDYQIRTERRGVEVIQAAIYTGPLQEERHRLYAGLGIATVVGMAAAIAAGFVLSRRAIAPLADALARQRRFVADASHELRTPLTHVALRAQVLARALRAGRDPKPLVGEADRLVIDAKELGAVVEDLLLSARLAAAQGVGGAPSGGSSDGAVAAEPVDLDVLVLDLVETHAGQAEVRGINLRAEPTRLAIRGTIGPVLLGARTALRRAVGALVDNAVVRARTTVVVEVTRVGSGRTRIAVRDDGPGFDPADAERLFVRFARGDAGDGRRFGLGLALAREVVEAHGGSVTGTGEPGVGAVFTVELPTPGYVAAAHRVQPQR